MMMLSDATTYLSDTKTAKAPKFNGAPKANKSLYKGNFKGFLGFMHKLKDGK